ncbi:helix-turn-helix domain-containing protein [bacterium]|nr:MAG: helix-turn-helix domain-containing protein [bacterium]
MTKAEKKVEGDLKNNLKAIRTRLGLSQADLAQAAGVARQTIGGIEASHYAPSAAVALRLSKALGCPVEEIFWLEESAQTLKATKVGGVPNGPEERVLLGKVGPRWVAHSLAGNAAFRSEMVLADGVVSGSGNSPKIEVQLLDSPDSLARTVLIAGCSPALSLWTRSAQRWHPGLRAAWIHANSSQALAALGRCEVHIAGVHLYDPETGEENTPFVRRFVPEGEVVLINFGIWDEGLLVAAGDPHGIEGTSSLTQLGLRFVNREAGAGSRMLFDNLLLREELQPGQIDGYSWEETSHQAVARAVAENRADAGMGTAAMAQIYGLGFVPLRRVRFDFAVRAEFLKQEPVSQLFETLAHRSVRLQLEKLGGYDTSRSGEIVARL